MALRYSDGRGDPVNVLGEISVGTTAFLPTGDLSYSKIHYCDAMGSGSGTASLSGRFVIDVHEDDAEQLAQQLSGMVGHLVLVGRPTDNSSTDRQFVCLGVITSVDTTEIGSYRAQVFIKGMFAQQGYPLFYTGGGDYLPRDLTVIDLTPFSAPSGASYKTLVASVRTEG